jgi:hypothetical protein
LPAEVLVRRAIVAFIVLLLLAAAGLTVSVQIEAEPRSEQLGPSSTLRVPEVLVSC